VASFRATRVSSEDVVGEVGQAVYGGPDGDEQGNGHREHHGQVKGDAGAAVLAGQRSEVHS
jgi:hypothetical protein